MPTPSAPVPPVVDGVEESGKHAHGLRHSCRAPRQVSRRLRHSRREQRQRADGFTSRGDGSAKRGARLETRADGFSTTAAGDGMMAEGLPTRATGRLKSHQDHANRAAAARTRLQALPVSFAEARQRARDCKTRTARAVTTAAPVATSHRGHGADGEAGAGSSAGDATLAGEPQSDGATARAADCDERSSKTSITGLP